MEKEVKRWGLFDSIDAHYSFVKSNPKRQRGKDSIQWIAPYMNVLYRYSLECEHITEFGINQVNSTWAFLKARPKKLVSVDIDLHGRATKNVPEFAGKNLWLLKAIELAAKESIEFDVVEGDSASIDIESTDLLFIDSKHTTDHLRAELNRHSDKVRKYIILHDTTLFAAQLSTPIMELLGTGHFEVNKKINTGCGLTILKRKQ